MLPHVVAFAEEASTEAVFAEEVFTQLVSTEVLPVAGEAAVGAVVASVGGRLVGVVAAGDGVLRQ